MVLEAVLNRKIVIGSVNLAAKQHYTKELNDKTCLAVFVRVICDTDLRSVRIVRSCIQSRHLL